MKRSKLETHIAVLQVLEEKGSLIPTHITYETYLNCSCVKACLNLLLNQKLIQENGINKRKTYTITDIGRKALQIANKIDNSLKIFNQPNLII
ncbi:MAG: winged helix-turn-helix domain-containing protein [Candidatus Bathyarchaeota archaeon]